MRLKEYLRGNWHKKPVIDISCGQEYDMAYLSLSSKRKRREGLITCFRKGKMTIMGAEVNCWHIKFIHYSHVKVK